MNLHEEAENITKLLLGKKVKQCIRNSEGEFLIIFECGARLFVNGLQKLDFSITGC